MKQLIWIIAEVINDLMNGVINNIYGAFTNTLDQKIGEEYQGVWFGLYTTNTPTKTGTSEITPGFRTVQQRAEHAVIKHTEFNFYWCCIVIFEPSVIFCNIAHLVVDILFNDFTKIVGKKVKPSRTYPPISLTLSINVS